MKYVIISPFFGKTQGKFPSYMLNFFLSLFEKYNLKIICTNNGAPIIKKFIYPIEFSPARNDPSVIYYGPDSILLLFKRCILSKEQYLFIKILAIVRYLQYSYVYSIIHKQSKIITVGMADAEDFKARGFTDVHYLPHPVDLPRFKKIKKNSHKLTNRKITIGISGALGRFNLFYCGKWYARLPKILNDQSFKEKYAFSILGKQYQKLALSLQKLGYVVNYREWIEDYTEFLSEIDIYMCLMAVGSGTKNRVLAANAARKRVIGTSFALENIYCDQNYMISSVDQLKEILIEIEYDESLAISDESLSSFNSNHSRQTAEILARRILEI
jgi:hypothetical protein